MRSDSGERHIDDRHDTPRPQAIPRVRRTGAVTRFLQATEIDTRMLGMVGALLVIWIGLHVLSGGLFLTPRNLWNLSVQTSSIAVMATGMVLVIVTRNIDLSVGSIARRRRHDHGRGAGRSSCRSHRLRLRQSVRSGSSRWSSACCSALLIGAFQGFIIAYLEFRPSSSRSAACWSGAARPGWSPAARPSRRWTRPSSSWAAAPTGSIGATWSWIVGVVACAASSSRMLNGASQRKRFNFPLRPRLGEMLARRWSPALLVLGAVWIANSYPWPVGIAEQICRGEQHHHGRRAACSSPMASPFRC